jgi:hypothetical protein
MPQPQNHHAYVNPFAREPAGGVRRLHAEGVCGAPADRLRVRPSAPDLRVRGLEASSSLAEQDAED